MSLAGYALWISVLAVIVSVGSVLYARRSAAEATRANDLEADRERRANRPEIELMLTGDFQMATLLVQNHGTVTVDELRLEIVGPDHALNETQFRSSQGEPVGRTHTFSALMPAMPQEALVWLMQADGVTAIRFVCEARTPNDVWAFNVPVDPPPRAPWAFSL